MKYSPLIPAPPEFPKKQVSFSIAAMLLALTASTFFTWRMEAQIKEIMTAQIEVLTGTERLQHFGSVLELSIKAVVATGDEQAVMRYRATQPQLRATLSELRRVVELQEDRFTLAEVDKADATLVAMEMQAIDLANKGALDEARAVIDSTQYNNLVAVYFGGLEVIESRAETFVEATDEKLNWYLTAILALSFATFAIVVFGWIALLRPARRWGEQIEEARQEAEYANREFAESQVELQLANARLFEQARVDHLTKLHTRLKLKEDAEKLWPRVERYGERYCALICDIDNFKQYNDTYGHIAGDRVLKEVAKALASQTRDEDHIYRFGGEEFVIILPNCGIEKGEASAERYRRVIEELGIPHTGSTAGIVTISIGVASLDCTLALTLEGWIAEADAALYEAKRSGRNRVSAGAALASENARS